MLPFFKDSGFNTTYCNPATGGVLVSYAEGWSISSFSTLAPPNFALRLRCTFLELKAPSPSSNITSALLNSGSLLASFVFSFSSFWESSSLESSDFSSE